MQPNGEEHSFTEYSGSNGAIFTTHLDAALRGACEEEEVYSTRRKATENTLTAFSVSFFCPKIQIIEFVLSLNIKLGNIEVISCVETILRE